MVKTRAQTRKLKSKVASYRRRVKQSKCRGLTRTCRKAKGCKMTKSGKRKTYCRKVANRKIRSLKGGRSRARRAGSVIGDAAVPLALIALNNYYKPKKGKTMFLKKSFKFKGGKSRKLHKKSKKHYKKSKKSRKGGKKSKKHHKKSKKRHKKSKKSKKH